MEQTSISLHGLENLVWFSNRSSSIVGGARGRLNICADDSGPKKFLSWEQQDARLNIKRWTEPACPK